MIILGMQTVFKASPFLLYQQKESESDGKKIDKV